MEEIQSSENGTTISEVVVRFNKEGFDFEQAVGMCKMIRERGLSGKTILLEVDKTQVKIV